MKKRSYLTLAIVSLAAASTMGAPAFAKSHHHHGKKAAVAKTDAMKHGAIPAAAAPAAPAPKK